MAEVNGVTYWVETTGANFSCPVKFASLDSARAAARSFRANGAFQVRIYAIADGAYTGTLVDEAEGC